MIEVLANYIRSKGFDVRVGERSILYIRKVIGNQKLGIDWMISEYEMALSQVDLFQAADDKLVEFTYAVNAEREQA
jgi:hypothetical protein